ncbi:hypothetical protein [Halomarina oriensis]|uniref:hypothetical protein n=1 Tax=Halomarina oriensis TaxID=671145 RepID=UPI00130399D0|nr:hypothetical protein [Halomarina oriensis]
MESRRSMLKLLGAGLGGVAVVAAGGFALDQSRRDDRPPARPGSSAGETTDHPLAPNGRAYFVAPDGADGNEGTMAAPFGTVDRAVGASRRATPSSSGVGSTSATAHSSSPISTDGPTLAVRWWGTPGSDR